MIEPSAVHVASTVVVFSSDFEENAFALIDKLPYSSIEKLMKAQKKNFPGHHNFAAEILLHKMNGFCDFFLG